MSISSESPLPSCLVFNKPPIFSQVPTPPPYRHVSCSFMISLPLWDLDLSIIPPSKNLLSCPQPYIKIHFRGESLSCHPLGFTAKHLENSPSEWGLRFPLLNPLHLASDHITQLKLPSRALPPNCHWTPPVLVKLGFSAAFDFGSS